MSYMLETLENLTGTQGGDNPAVESISRKDVLLAWLAGAIDGEGCIFAYFRTQTNPKCKGTRTLTVGLTISNGHPLFIEKVTTILSMIGVKFTYTIANRDVTERDRVNVSVKVTGKGGLKKALIQLIPYLSCKRKQAELVLELIDYRESLVIRAQDKKGIFAKMSLEDDTKIVDLVKKIKDEKWEYRSPMKTSRKANEVFNVSSTTLCSSAVD